MEEVNMLEPEKHLHLIETVLNSRYGGGYATARRLGIDIEDLFQIGSMGLIKACINYDPMIEAKFETYAFIKIHGEILRYVRDDSTVGRYSRQVRELAPKLRKLEEVTPKAIEESLGVTRALALDLHSYFHRMNVSLYRDVYESSTGDSLTYLDVIKGDESAEDVAVHSLDLEERLSLLPSSQRQVCEFILLGKSQNEVAATMGLSQSHVSRLLKKAILKIQNEYLLEKGESL